MSIATHNVRSATRELLVFHNISFSVPKHCAEYPDRVSKHTAENPDRVSLKGLTHTHTDQRDWRKKEVLVSKRFSGDILELDIPMLGNVI